MTRDHDPLAWMYHRNTSRYPFNLHGPNEPGSRVPPFKEYLDAPLIPLPTADLPTMPLGEALCARLSCRSYSGAPITPQQLATILKAGYGVHDRLFLGDQEFLERSVPSGGGLYPLEIYLLARRIAEVAPGVYHYAVGQGALEQSRELELPDGLIADLFLGQPYLIPAALIVVITAVPERSLWKYEDRGYRYILFEAGHVAQNINLTTAALGLGSLNLGGFFDANLARLLDIDFEHELPLYCTAIGVPATSDRAASRTPGTGSGG